jgi:hypothetical protein
VCCPWRALRGGEANKQQDDKSPLPRSIACALSPSPPRCSTRTRPRQTPVRPLIPCLQSTVLQGEPILARF